MYQKQRATFPYPQSHHRVQRLKTQQARKILEAVDEETIGIITRIRESEKEYKKGQEGAKQQTRAARSTQRTDYNFLSLNSSSPIKNTGTAENRQQPPERTTHFNPNTMHHFYATTEPASHTNRYKPAANDSIIQGAGTAYVAHFTTGTTAATGRNKPWRNTGNNTAAQQIFPTLMTNKTDCNSLFSESPNSLNNRNAPTCFRCGEQCHMRNEYFAAIAKVPTTATEHAESSEIIHLAQ